MPRVRAVAASVRNALSITGRQRATCALVAVTVLGPATSASAAPALLVERLKRDLGFSESDVAASRGGPVVRELEDSDGAALFVAGVVRIDATPDAIAAELRRTGGLVDRDAVLQAGALHAPPVPADVAAFELPEGDIEALVDCELGDCKLKLQAGRIREFERLDWSADDILEQVRAIARRAVIEYVARYVANGHAALAIYADKEQESSAEQGFQKILATAKYVRRSVAEIDRFFEQYPHSTVPGATDYLRWSVEDYGFRPVTSVSHTLVLDRGDVSPGDPSVIVAQKYLFTTHYFTARVESAGLFADDAPDAGTYLVYVDRSLFDGELGTFKRRMLVSGALKNVAKRLSAVRAHFGAGR